MQRRSWRMLLATFPQLRQISRFAGSYKHYFAGLLSIVRFADSVAIEDEPWISAFWFTNMEVAT